MLLWFGFCACDVKHQGSNVARVQIPVSTRGLSLLLVRPLAQRCFSPGTRFSPLPKTNTSKLQFDLEHLFLRTSKCFMGEQITIYNLL